MNLAILSDIHGNHYALSVVLDQLREESIDNIIILGDFVGYYYRCDIVLHMLKDWEYRAILGNHERILKKIFENPGLIGKYYDKYGSGHIQALNRLSTFELNYLLNLPENIIQNFHDNKIGYFHGSPWDVDEYVYPQNNEENVEKCFSFGYKLLFLGHTHYQFKIENNGNYIINPGSVGQSRRFGGFAEFAIFNTDSLDVSLRNIAYDIHKLEAEVKEIDPKNKYLIDILHRRSY